MHWLYVNVKGESKCIYIGDLFVVSHTQDAQVWITQFYLHLHQCLPIPCKHSPDGATQDCGCGHLIAAYYSFIYPERTKG